MSVRLVSGSKTWRVIQDNQMNYQKAKLLEFNEKNGRVETIIRQ